MYQIARKRIGAAKKIITFAFHLDRRRARAPRHRPADRGIFRMDNNISYKEMRFWGNVKAGQVIACARFCFLETV